MSGAEVRANPASLRLYAVTDNAWLEGRTLGECVVEALRGGVTFLQLRDKHASSDELANEYVAVKATIRDAEASGLLPEGVSDSVPFVINDDVQAALACGADGVHVGQSDAACAVARELLGPGKIVGVSVQTVAQALEAQAAGADYLGVGALFKTATKPEAADVSLDTLREICEAVSIPVVGIGGLNERTIPSLAGTGVAGVAVVSAVFAAEDIVAASANLREGIEDVL